MQKWTMCFLLVGVLSQPLYSQDVKINDEGIPGIQARVEMISDIGAEIYIHAHLGSEKLTLRAPKNVKMMPDDLITLTIDPRSLHFFHQGNRIEPMIKHTTNHSHEFAGHK